MTPLSSSIAGLGRSLHPLDAVPKGPGWNIDELQGLLPAEAMPADAAVLVGLVDRDDGIQVILTRRTDALRQHAGQVSFPGGRLEADDNSALDAALREANEEIGLAAAQASPLGYLDPLTTITGYRVVPVVAEISRDFVARPDPGEVAAVFEVPLAFLLQHDSLRRVDIEFGGRIRHVLEFKPYISVPEQRIWGATASILLNLRERIEAAA